MASRNVSVDVLADTDVKFKRVRHAGAYHSSYRC